MKNQRTIGQPADRVAYEAVPFRQVEHELIARLRQQAAVAELGQRALASDDLQALMDETAILTARTLDVEYCDIWELLPEVNSFVLRAGVGWKDGLVGSARVDAGQGSQVGYILAVEKPVVVSDLRNETRFHSSPLLLEHGVVSGMSVVIEGKEHPYGILGIHTNIPREYTEDSTLFLQAVANVLALAIARQRTEIALRSSRNQLNIILQGVADGITVQDRTGQLVYANEAAARLTGYSSVQDLMETPISQVTNRFELFDEAGQPFPVERLPGRLALSGVSSASATVCFRPKGGGEERWSFVKARPVFHKDGQVELAVNIFQDVNEIKRNEKHQRLLAEAGSLLAASLDYRTTLASVTQLAVRELADWCLVHILEEDGQARQVAIAHMDPRKIELAHQLQTRYPINWNASGGLSQVLRTGQAAFYPDIADEMLVAGAQDQEHLRLLREIGMRSVIILPLLARGRTLGALTLVWADSGQQYTPADVALAEDLARHAAMAIDNSRLYKEAQELNAQLEARVNQRTNQLQTLIVKLRSEMAERVKTQEALQRNEAVLQSLFQSAPDAILLINDQGNIARLNSQAEAMFGYPPDELIGKSVDILLPKRFQNNHANFRARYLKDPRTRPMGAGLQLYGKRKDGTEFPVDIMLSPVETEAGMMVISAVRDITERKEIEAELNELQRRLYEHLEAERIYLAQELHDGPIQDLYAITYQAKDLESMLNSEASGNKYQQEFEQLDKLLIQVVNQLRSICGELRPPTLAPFGLQKAIEGHLDGIQNAHPELTIHTNLTPDGQMLPEQTRLALFRIYQHSVSNVIRHANAQLLNIGFRFDDQQVVLEIQDDGQGFVLPERWIELARKGHLGLVGTAERAQAVGGKLDIISAPGKGTTIRVTAPRDLDKRRKTGKDYFTRQIIN